MVRSVQDVRCARTSRSSKQQSTIFFFELSVVICFGVGCLVLVSPSIIRVLCFNVFFYLHQLQLQLCCRDDHSIIKKIGFSMFNFLGLRFRIQKLNVTIIDLNT